MKTKVVDALVGLGGLIRYTAICAHLRKLGEADLLEKMDEDPLLGRLMLQHILRSVRQRLQDLRVECLTGSAA